MLRDGRVLFETREAKGLRRSGATPCYNGGADENRTHDLLNAIQETLAFRYFRAIAYNRQIGHLRRILVSRVC